jgi:translation initiation factor 6
MMLKADYERKSSIGVFARASEKHAIVPHGGGKLGELLSRALGVVPKEVSIFSSPLIGVYSCINSNLVLLPWIVDSSEVKSMKELNPVLVEEKYLALGNLIAINDKKAVVSPLLSKGAQNTIRGTGLDVIVRKVGGHEISGSCLLLTNSGFVTSPDVCEEELKELERDLNLRGAITTVNRGSPYVSSGIIANSKGVVVGYETTPVEVNHIDQALVI